MWDAYRTDLLDLDRHARHGSCSSPSSTGEIVGSVAFYPDATDQDLGWPAGWASGRALAVHPCHRGHGVAGALLRELEQRTRESGAAVFAFHTSRFMAHRTGHLRADGLPAGAPLRPGAERPLRRAPPAPDPGSRWPTSRSCARRRPRDCAA